LRRPLLYKAKFEIYWDYSVEKCSWIKRDFSLPLKESNKRQNLEEYFREKIIEVEAYVEMQTLNIYYKKAWKYH
jgi:hypothetical protein